MINYKYGQPVEARYADSDRFEWHTGFRFLAYGLDNTSCVIERASGPFYGIPLRHDLSDIREGKAVPANVEREEAVIDALRREAAAEVSAYYEVGMAVRERRHRSVIGRLRSLFGAAR